jgi:hypothetical protein
MPWYQTPEESGYWGWHWKMDFFDPNQVDENGRQQLASHYMPLTGAYDSADEYLLEYQVLLMKMSGIDGVIVDWYGASSFNDYAVINKATGRLFEAVKKAGLLFSICYEDQTIRIRVDGGNIANDQDYAQGQADMQYLQDTWFKDEAYLKWQERPVLFNFGPQYFINGQDWEALFMPLETRPALVTLDGHFVAASVGGYPWPPMGQSGGGELSQAALESYLEAFYKKTEINKLQVGGAFPRFNDIYQAAGVRLSYGHLDDQDGLTFEQTLQKALDQQPDMIQLITWNDYGEGTNIEPTEEYGYKYLEALQETQEALGNDEFRYTPEDLPLAYQLFQLRKSHADAESQGKLDEAFELLLTGQTQAAENLMEEIGG